MQVRFNCLSRIGQKPKIPNMNFQTKYNVGDLVIANQKTPIIFTVTEIKIECFDNETGSFLAIQYRDSYLNGPDSDPKTKMLYTPWVYEEYLELLPITDPLLIKTLSKHPSSSWGGKFFDSQLISIRTIDAVIASLPESAFETKQLLIRIRMYLHDTLPTHRVAASISALEYAMEDSSVPWSRRNGITLLNY